RAIAAWQRSRRLKRKMPSGPTVSARTWSASAPRIVNRMKSTLARLGLRGFKPTLRKAAERLDRLRTAEGVLLPPNTLAERPHGTSPWAEGPRDMARLRFVMDQIREIEAARLIRLEQPPELASHAMVRLLARVI